MYSQVGYPPNNYCSSNGNIFNALSSLLSYISISELLVLNLSFPQISIVLYRGISISTFLQKTSLLFSLTNPHIQAYLEKTVIPKTSISPKDAHSMLRGLFAQTSMYVEWWKQEPSDPPQLVIGMYILQNDLDGNLYYTLYISHVDWLFLEYTSSNIYVCIQY